MAEQVEPGSVVADEVLLCLASRFTCHGKLTLQSRYLVGLRICRVDGSERKVGLREMVPAEDRIKFRHVSWFDELHGFAFREVHFQCRAVFQRRDSDSRCRANYI